MMYRLMAESEPISEELMPVVSRCRVEQQQICGCRGPSHADLVCTGQQALHH